jgi:hypothetical protein
VVLDERLEGCGGGVAPAVDGSESVGPRARRRLREGAAGRGPAGAGRPGRGHADDGAAPGGAAEWRGGSTRGSGRRRNSPVVSGIAYPVSRHSSQEVCPWNSSKFVTITRGPDFDPDRRERGAGTFT